MEAHPITIERRGKRAHIEFALGTKSFAKELWK
jgi:hypothetical protein